MKMKNRFLFTMLPILFSLVLFCPSISYSDEVESRRGVGYYYDSNTGTVLPKYDDLSPQEVMEYLGRKNGGGSSNSGTIPGATGILALTPEEIAELPPRDVAMMSDSDFESLTEGQRGALTERQLAERAVAVEVRGLSYSKFGEIALENIGYLSNEQIATIPSSWWFDQISPESRAMMSKEQVQALNTKKSGIRGLTSEQCGYLTVEQVRGVKGSDLQYVPKSKFSYVTPEQISEIPSSWYFDQIPPENRAVMNKEQVQALNTKKSGIRGLTSEQCEYLSAEQVRGVKGSHLQYVPESKFSHVTPEQISEIPSSWYFGQISKENRNSMNKEQILAISDEIFPSIRKKLTPEQQSWRK